MQIICFPKEKLLYFWQRFQIGSWRKEHIGEMSEWFKEHAWKVCVLQKGTAGSNPALSADK